MQIFFGLDQDVIEKIQSVFKRFPKLEKVSLYGSRAKGNFKPGSDIDLALFGSELSTTDLLKIENELDDLMLPYTFDLSLFHKLEQADMIEHIQRVSQDFYVRR